MDQTNIVDNWNSSSDGLRIPRPIYCAEQIIIPESFPNILKAYAKGE